MGLFKVGQAPADWSQDSPELKRERFGYYFTGWATGPDTVLGTLWSVGLLAAASVDATCHAGPTGLSSGADGQKCTPIGDWNQSLFESVGGDACYAGVMLGENKYYHDSSLPGCMSAFQAYRAEQPFTCNCSGASADHAYLGEGGARPSIMFTLASTIALITIAIIQPIFGTYTDFSSSRKKMWWVFTALTAISTLAMAGIGPGGVWLIGFVGSIMTAVFSEIQLPIRASYLEDVAQDAATMGYLGAMRQATSYTSQLITVLIYVVFQTIVPGSATHSIFVALVAGVWFSIFMPICISFFKEHGAKRTLPPGKNFVAVCFVDLAEAFKSLSKYPEAMKFLAATAILQVGGPVVIVIASTFATQGLEMPGILFTAVSGMVLVFGVPAALSLSQALKTNCIGFKRAWIITLFFFLLIGSLVPALADGPNLKSWIVVIVLAGLLGGIALSWFYSIGWTAFCTLIPFGQAGQYAGIYHAVNALFTLIGPLIYSAVVQATSNHQLGWLITCLPATLVSLAVICITDFDKGERDANRKEGSAKSVTSSA